MAEYHLVLKLAGYAKEHVRRRIYIAARRFNIWGVSKEGPLPEVKLCGPFATARETELVEAVSDVASGFDVVSFRLKGFSHFDVSKKWLLFSQGMRGIYLEVDPSSNLERMRQELEKRIRPLCDEEPADSGDFRYRAMVDFKDIDDRFDKVLAFLRDDDEKNISQRVLKLTVLRDGEAFFEYDLVQRKALRRPPERQKNRYFKRTISIIRQRGEDALQPIWLKAYGIARPGRRLRQVTLVDDNPTIRLPKMLQVRMPSFKGPKPEEGTRQVTLVEDDPSQRLPGIFRAVGKKRKKKPKTQESKLAQTRLEYDVSGGFSYGLPAFKLPEIFGRRKRRK